MWKCIRDKQKGRRGHVPCRSVSVCDEYGNPCLTMNEQEECWRQHFTGVLNVRSQFDVCDLEAIRQRPVMPSTDEVITALKLVKMERYRVALTFFLK